MTERIVPASLHSVMRHFEFSAQRKHSRVPCLVVAVGLCLAARTVGWAETPNVLFVFADDQAFHTIAALGNDEIQTPHLDRLVRRGLTFTHAYNQGAWGGAVCVASRTMLVTGRYLWHARRDYDQTDAKYREKNLLWPQLLAQGGYRTYFTGKWHIRANAEKAFDVARHVRPGMPNQTKQGYNRPLPNQTDVWQPWDKSRGGFWKGGRHWSEIVADDAVDYLHDAKTDAAPFFMYVAFNAPHDPRQSPQEFVERYPADQIRIPESFAPLYPFDIGSNRIRDEQLGPFPRTEHAVQVHRSEYYAIITHMDQQIGRIMEALEATGKADDTVICFTADHGLAVGHHGLMGKQNMYDHSIRVPFVVAGPGIPSNAKRHDPIYLQDFMPTSLELAGLDVPPHVEFQSCLPWQRAEESSHAPIYGAYTDTQRMICDQGYKLVLYPKIHKMLLFNLTDDPEEMYDLSELPEQRLRIVRMLHQFAKLQGATGDKLEMGFLESIVGG